MIVFRLSQKAYKDDLSGLGASIYGGRWNPKGSAMLYTCESRALASVEIMANTSPGLLPLNYYVIEIEIPENFSILQIKPNDLGGNWKKKELLTQRRGYDFLETHKYPVMKIPSVCVPKEFNYLLNPLHKLFNEVTILPSELFEFDKRLFRK